MTDDRADHELLRAWRAKDAGSCDLLVRRHFASIYAFLRSKTPEHVDELVQATFLACVESVERIDEARSFRAYLFGIARRQLIYYYRQRQRHLDRFDPMLESVRDALGSPSQIVAIRQEELVVLDALNVLPLDLQITLELHYWEGMAVAEIGEVLGVPAGTVKSRLHRARESLRAALALVTEAGTSDGLQRGLAGLHRALQPLLP